MFDAEKNAFIAISGKKELCILPSMANRHGLITGATGTPPTQAMLDCARSLPLTEKIECGVSSPDVATLSMLPFT